MPSKNPAQRLCDIIDNIDAIAAFTAGLEFTAFRTDRKTVYAVVRALEIISEASRRLPGELLERHPEIDWAAIAAAGNLYRHEYEVVDEALVWHTVRYDLAALPQHCGGGVRSLPVDDVIGARRGPRKNWIKTRAAAGRGLPARR